MPQVTCSETASGTSFFSKLSGQMAAFHSVQNGLLMSRPSCTRAFGSSTAQAHVWAPVSPACNSFRLRSRLSYHSGLAQPLSSCPMASDLCPWLTWLLNMNTTCFPCPFCGTICVIYASEQPVHETELVSQRVHGSVQGWKVISYMIMKARVQAICCGQPCAFKPSCHRQLGNRPGSGLQIACGGR